MITGKVKMNPSYFDVLNKGDYLRETDFDIKDYEDFIESEPWYAKDYFLDLQIGVFV